MTSEETGTIIEWQADKGYGFVAHQGGRVFLHIKDFAERHKRPTVGDQIRFVFGRDAKGRSCATRAAHVRDGGRFTISHLLFLLGLLVLPGVAAYHLPMHRGVFCGYAMCLSFFTYAMYAHDKHLARTRTWRLPEAALHFFEILGGWPGAFIAQRYIRHKSAKPSFQITFWLIVLLHQFIALDYLLDWQLSHLLWERISETGLSR